MKNFIEIDEKKNLKFLRKSGQWGLISPLIGAFLHVGVSKSARTGSTAPEEETTETFTW